MIFMTSRTAAVGSSWLSQIGRPAARFADFPGHSVISEKIGRWSSMSRPNDSWEDDHHPLNQAPGPDASAIALDPYKILAASTLEQSIRDFKSRDLMASLDALLFWLDPAGGSLWLEELDFPSDVDHVFKKLLEA